MDEQAKQMALAMETGIPVDAGTLWKADTTPGDSSPGDTSPHDTPTPAEADAVVVELAELPEDTLSETIEQLQAAHEAKLRQVRIDGEVRYVLAKMGAKNPALAAKVLDLSRVQADDEGVVGVEEAVQQLMVSDPYLFGLSMGPVGGERSSGGIHGTPRRDPGSMSDREYYAMVMGKC